MTRRWLFSLISVLLIASLYWGWTQRVPLRDFPDIISAYTAKQYCSCRYVMQHPADYCHGYVKQAVPISELIEMPEARRVIVSGLGRTHSARWMGARQGCALEP